MRLVRLRLQNYRRHRDTRIEWPDGVTAVIGRNGSGKSSLLEAIGFALFGAGATRTAKDLLRLDLAGPGEHVRVDLEAEIDGHAVRVVRELRGKNLTPNASLEVDGIVQTAPGAGSNEAATQQVEALLGMGREAFFTTVVARQKELAGLADVSPAERKRRLLHMVGVDRLEEAIRSARQKRRDAEARADAVRSVLDDPKALADALAQAKAELQHAEQEVRDADAAWQQGRGLLAGREEEARAQEAAATAYADLVRRRTEAARAVSAAGQALDQAQRRLEAARQAAEEADRLAPEAARLPAAEQAVERARLAAQEAAAHETARKRVADLEAEAARATAAVPEPPAPPEVDLDAADAALGRARDALAGAQQEQAVANERAEALRARHRRLSGLSADAPCPTCERPLGDHHEQVLAELHRHYEEAQEAVGKARSRADACAASVQEADAARAAARRRHDAHRDAVAARERAVARRDDAVERARQAAASLPPAPDDPPALAPLEEDLRLARRAHEARVAALARAEGQEAAAKEADAARQALDEARRALEAAEARLAANPDPQEPLARALAARDEARQAEREAERRAQEARRRHGLAAERLDAARRRTEEDERRRAVLRELEEDARYWAALAGTRHDGLLDGFRDHLVQRIGPAIAQEAGRLLARFTGGRYDEVLLDEDYRLYVTDHGVPYQIDRFSGGEADLVHLALRLAVSRLLAERGGAGEVRFLALDEVFGSLDHERRGLVVGALQELGTLYAQVLLVTHLDAMRDALDQAVHVEDVEGTARVTLL